MAFTEKYGDGSSKDDIGTSDETSARLRQAGFKIVRFAQNKMIYVGQANSQNQPHGSGYLYFANGDLHEGLFDGGRAHGEGLLITAKGDEYKGSWFQNRRKGLFNIVDGEGVLWTEKYDDDGKRAFRRKNRVKIPNPAHNPADPKPDVPEQIEEQVPPVEAAKKCWNCNNFSRAATNHAWSCRVHAGRWTEDKSYRGDGVPPGVWWGALYRVRMLTGDRSCCGCEKRDEPGCTFKEHNYM